MIQYLAKFPANLSEISGPLMKLLERDVEWHWEDPQKKSFEQLKQLVTSAQTLKFYDVNKPACSLWVESTYGLSAKVHSD